jgi:hypothetical protein
MALVAYPNDLKVVFTHHTFCARQAIILPLKLEDVMTLGAGGSFTNL